MLGCLLTDYIKVPTGDSLQQKDKNVFGWTVTLLPVQSLAKNSQTQNQTSCLSDKFRLFYTFGGRTQMFFFEYSGSLWWICWVWKDPIPALKDRKRPPVGGSSRHNGTVASPSAELGQGPAKELRQCREEDGRTVRMRRDSATCCNMKCHGPRSSFCRKQVAEKCWVETNETGKVESQESYY